MVFDFVESREEVRASLDRQTDGVKRRVRDPILVIIFDLKGLGHSVNLIIHMKCVEGVVGSNVGSCVLVKVPVLWVTLPIKFEVTQPLKGLLV
jgi:hypothetical protein